MGKTRRQEERQTLADTQAKGQYQEQFTGEGEVESYHKDPMEDKTI